MTRWGILDLLLMAVALMLAAMAMLAAVPAHSHEWYARRSDPVYNNGCCGGNDCRELNGARIEAEADGYRIRLTLLQARTINSYAASPINALVTWARIQPSEDGNYHLCIFSVDREPPRNGVICLFAPPSM